MQLQLSGSLCGLRVVFYHGVLESGRELCAHRVT